MLYQHEIDTILWSIDDNRLLGELKASKVPWKRISMVMDDGPVWELQRRWVDIQSVKHRLREVDQLINTTESWFLDQERDGGEHHVSFGTLRGEEEDTDEDEDNLTQQPKVKKVYYIDDEFAIDDVLLHQTVADWQKDRWKPICSRFNDMTGRSITPAQAKSVIDG